MFTERTVSRKVASNLGNRRSTVSQSGSKVDAWTRLRGSHNFTLPRSTPTESVSVPMPMPMPVLLPVVDHGLTAGGPVVDHL